MKEFEKCSCDESLYLRELLTDAMNELVTQWPPRDGRQSDQQQLIDKIKQVLLDK
jgi:hypothetical protein